MPVVDPLVGRAVGGRFRILRRLGSGGMSTVYLAEDRFLGGRRALKVLRRDLTRDPVQRGRFAREARLVNRIHHPNIVEVTDYDEGSEGLFYLVMEYVPGVSLFREIRRGPLEPARAVGIARQVTEALGRAHGMDVIHRDLKPENIFLVQEPEAPGDAGAVSSRTGKMPPLPTDRVKVLDFGIAKVNDFPTLTQSLQIIGTPGYIAPEYIQANRIDGRADLYSLGVVLYEMLTGGLQPFDYRFRGDLLVKPITEEPLPLSGRGPGVPAGLEALVMRALARDPDRRFRDAFEMGRALDKVLTAMTGAPAPAVVATAEDDAAHRVPGGDAARHPAATAAAEAAREARARLRNARARRGRRIDELSSALSRRDEQRALAVAERQRLRALPTRSPDQEDALRQVERELVRREQQRARLSAELAEERSSLDRENASLEAELDERMARLHAAMRSLDSDDEGGREGSTIP
jgi:serine/threonine-protein kinase